MGSALSKTLLFFIALMIGGSLLFSSFLDGIRLVKNKAEIKIGSQYIIADIVTSDKDKERGLGGRGAMGVNEGMWFVFDKAADRGFWMKDMRFPIDLIWIREGVIVGFEEEMQPEPGKTDSELTIYYAPEPADRVLELTAGRIKLLKAKVGDEVKSRPLLNTQ